MFNPLQSIFGMNQGQNEADALPGNSAGRGPQVDEPGNVTTQQHLHPSKLARLRPNLPTLTPTLNEPLARSIFDARCEISSYRCASPIRFYSSPKGVCLALAGMSGWKNRSPALDYLVLNQPQNTDPHNEFSNARFLEPGLADIAYHAAVDDARRLIFIGDGKRVKSYEWGTNTEVYRDPLPVHTLNSGHAEGPITTLPNGTVVRTGKGSASVWNIDALPTHDEDDVIGYEIEINGHSWRDDPENIERSSGSRPTSQIKYTGISKFEPTQWKPLVSAPSTLICAEYEREEADGTFTCVGLDLQTGQTTTKYLGHGKDISEFSVSAAEPQVFLTACHDGVARLFDIRQQNPVLRLTAGQQSDYCEGAALAHPNGIPIIFTGTRKGEAIKTWDVRAQACVYELSTGNNAVQSLAWDAHNNTLYAATECLYLDRVGTSRGYRKAITPQGQTHDSRRLRCWPKAARHKEDYFGYMFDAGDHRIFRYTFKENSNPDVLPEYGNAILDKTPSSAHEAMEALIHNMYINNFDHNSDPYAPGSPFLATNTYSL
ncbi:hypothetical protein FRC11_003223 [Ceratobasidium sp. 423]|nr:hypothetical protein FRC11_003223 [Ceratobasidium sp. 423]